MATADNSSGRDAEIRRLREDLKQTQLRLEEVTNYYRGEIEAVRKRSEDQLLQVQADEAARRRRAEEQVTQLNAELKSARSEAEKSKRRYQALLDRIEKIEAESRAEVTAERNRYEDSARAAWQTAEEEVERLNAELAELQRALENERNERQRVETEKADLEASYERRDDERQKLINRLKRALQASEQRREALETEGVAPSAPAAASQPAARAGETEGSTAAETQVQVDPSAGWGRFQLGEGDDISEEFLMIQADRSFAEPADAGEHEAKAEERAEPASGGSGQESVADDEAERLIMGVAVDRKVAQRQAESSDNPGETTRPRSHKPAMPEPEPPWWRRHRWLLIAGGLAGGVLAAGGIGFWL